MADDPVKAFLKMEDYLCNLLKVDVRALDTRIMAWAQQDSKRWAEYEELVRAGQRLKELQMYARSLSPQDHILETPVVAKPVPPVPLPQEEEKNAAFSGGIFDL